VNDRDDYVRQLERVIGKFQEPLKRIPYPIAIRALTGRQVLAFDLSVRANRELLELLRTAAHTACEEAHRKGIFARRPNEAGNHIEPFVVSALRSTGLSAEKPRTRTGRAKAAGYPDIEVRGPKGTIIYLDCKTYSAATRNQSFRTFYFSPSREPKITKDAFHLLLSFELTRQDRGGKMAFVPASWQLYTLEKVEVQVKHEFNASNRDLYRSEFLLAKGSI